MKYFHLPIQICHLLSLFHFFIIFSAHSQSSLNKGKPDNTTDVTFISKILDLVEPGKKFPTVATFPLDSFELFQKKSESHQIHVSYWQYSNYRYPLFVQVINNVVVDIYLTFPSFMLHDRIHEYFIKLWGKQSFFKQSSLSAIYQWTKQPNVIAIYEANCSITCFPVFLTMHQKKLPDKIQPLWLQFQNLQNKKLKK